MHELGIAMQIMSIVEQSLPPEEDLRVKSIRLKIGKLTAIVPNSLRFCMEIVTKDSRAEGARIEFEEVPAVLECEKCGRETVLVGPPFKCLHCGSDRVEVISGREMIVDSLEVEEKSSDVDG